MLYDVIIIGSGPAGLSAAIYAKRARLNVLVLEKEYVNGGQVNSTYEVENYPGIMEISGIDLASRFEEHALKFGVEIVTETVTDIEDLGEIKKITTEDGVYETKTIILATGATHRKLQVPGEEEHAGMGVSYCATCDGAFFKDKTVAVAGGGDVAVEDAIFLARGCKKVYLIHRRDELRAAKVLQEALFKCPNVEVLWDSNVTEIKGTGKVDSITIYNKKKDTSYDLTVDGIFIAVGIVPNSKLLQNISDMDEGGYIVADETCATSRPGFFAAGDVRQKPLRQVITAASDGANAITSIEKYLLK